MTLMTRRVSDELVVFEGAQALPLFLVYYKTPSGKNVAGNPTGAAAGVVSPGGDVEMVRKEMFSGGSSPSSSVQSEFSFVLVCSPLTDVQFCCLFRLDASSDSAKLLEQLMSKEVDDVLAQPQSVEEMRKALEDKDKVIEDQEKVIQEQGKIIEGQGKQLEEQGKQFEEITKEKDWRLEEQARRIKELEALLASKQ